MAGQGKFFVYTVDKLNIKYMIPTIVRKRFAFMGKNVWHFSTTDPTGENDMEMPEMILERTFDRLRFEIKILKSDDSVEYFTFGELVIAPISNFNEEEKVIIGKKVDSSGLCFINVNNRVFYDPLVTTYQPDKFYKRRRSLTKKKFVPNHVSQMVSNCPDQRKVKSSKPTTYNSIFLINQIADFLGIVFLSVFNMEIAMDTNVNFGAKILQAIRDPNLIPSINGTLYPKFDSTTRIRGLSLHYGVTRKSKVDMTLYLSQANRELRLKSYNKTKEIEGNSYKKQYIIDRVGKDCELFRLEVSVKDKWIKTLINKFYGVDREEDFFLSLSDEFELERMYKFFIDKLIYFKLVENEERIDVLDIITT